MIKVIGAEVVGGDADVTEVIGTEVIVEEGVVT